MSENSYYYRQLSKDQQQAYHSMYSGIMGLSAAFSVPKLEAKAMADVFFLLRLDHPEIFWASGFHYRFFPQSEHVEFIPEYLFKKKQIQSHQTAVEARIKKLVRAAQDLSEAEKELYVHDFICNQVRYDKLKKAYSHEIIGPLTQGVGVCEGIAKSVKVLCDALGLWCIIALSDNNPQKGIKYRHTWNVLKLGGQYYHIDVTFDNSLSEPSLIRYDYFNLADAALFRDHEPALFPIPACGDNGNFRYRVCKLSFTKLEEVRSRLVQAANKGKTLTFHWRGSYFTREVLQSIADMIGEVAAERNKYPVVNVNFPQAVVQVAFLNEKSDSRLVLQEANEGEQD